MTRESSFISWVRTHAVLFGILVGVGCCLILLLMMFYDLPLVDAIMGSSNIGWVRFLAYTAGQFFLLIKYCPPRLPRLSYWTLLTGLLILHTFCYVWFMLKVMPLGSIHYIVAGPVEFLILYFLLNRGIGYLGTEQAGKP
ncbi:MAG TPA: hypothetical protein VJX70_14075 [Candidatus Acidoferrum sp.]|nr:hypothetical protein [Candidatus Acidoferrum sp.]